jgi:hypothetical protein
MDVDFKQLGLVALVAALAILVQKWGRSVGKSSRSARLMKKYAVITAEVFDGIPQDELVEAMVCRVLSEAAAARRPDPVKTLAGLSHPYTVVYSTWAGCKELAAGDFAALMSTPTKELVEPAREAMQTIGAPECAAALEAMRAAYAEGREDAEAAKTYRLAVAKETPLSLCEEYIRDHREEFLDGMPAEE